MNLLSEISDETKSQFLYEENGVIMYGETTYSKDTRREATYKDKLMFNLK